MNCDLIRDLMPLYADGQASPASRRSIEEHTAQCPACRKMLQEMCAPLEPEPQDRTEKIMEMLYRKQRRKTVLTILSVFLGVLLAVWGFLELRYSGELIYVASTNEEKILKEVPELALTDAEKELAQTILEVPQIRDALGDDFTETTIFTTAEAAELFSSIMPEDAYIVESAVMGHAVYFSYTAGNVYTILQYTDADMTGHVDTIFKCVAVSSGDEITDGGMLADVDAVYELTYAEGIGVTRCQKIKSRHMWFSFLDW